MASLKEFFNTLKNKAETIFYEQSETENGYGYAQQEQNPYENAYAEQGNAFEQGWQQQPQQNTYQQTAYQQPQQNAYQQAAYQQPQQNAYQQQTENAQPHQQEKPNVVPFPNVQQQAADNAPACCVINARNVSECYSAIVQLRSGSMVIVVLENITDTMEMRHYVDMLSGACYALKGTITKLSRHGAYLIAPNHMRVCVDAATNQFNSPASRMQRPQSPFQQQMPPQQQQTPYQQPQQNAYQRPMQAANSMHMYTRPVSSDAGMAPNQARQPFNGHVTDMPLENAQ